MHSKGIITDDRVSKCVLELEIAKLREEIAEINRKIYELERRKASCKAKITLLVDHLDRSRCESTGSQSVDSEDSLRTSELLELSLSSTLDSSLFGYSSEMDDSIDDTEGDRRHRPSNEFRLTMPEGDTD